MKQVPLTCTVHEAAEHIKKAVQLKGFTLFADIDHQANAKMVDLEMPASRVLIFGNPNAGTKLMQADIAISYDLPIRVAIIEKNKQTLCIHPSSESYTADYQVENHPVLEKIDELMAGLMSELS